MAFKQIGCSGPVVLDEDFSVRGDLVAFGKQFPGFGRNLNLIGDAFRFHPAGNVDGIAPQVIGELPMTPAITAPEWTPIRSARCAG